MILPRPLVRWLQDLSLRDKLQVAILGTSATAILMAGLAIAALQWKAASDAVQRDLETLARVLAGNAVAAVSFNDVIAAEENLQALQARPNVIAACLFAVRDEQPTPLAEFRASSQAPDCSPSLLNESMPAGQFHGQARVVLAGEHIGELIIIENDDSLWESLRRNLIALLAILLACLLIAWLLSSLIQSLISTPVITLADTAARISETGNFSLRAREFGRDEVGKLIKTFNEMLAQIERSGAQLRSLNKDLEAQIGERNRSNRQLREALEQLERAQDQLVQTEKMASLGGLVAGVAHEINTPVGVGVTAASTLAARTGDVRQAYTDETLTADELERYLDIAAESSEIILGNLDRAANLIQSFKQVAVDQSSLDLRRFDVCAYIHEVLLSLRPKLKKTHIRLEVDCPKGLEIDSYPGALSQVLTNLVMNSLIHAYGPDDSGTIRVAVETRDGGIRLEYSDDGCGIPPEHLRKIFEPFFTTRRGSGGSGLGMHIVYNLVTQQMGGSITAHSTPGAGTQFTIDIKSKSHEQAEPLDRTG